MKGRKNKEEEPEEIDPDLVGVSGAELEMEERRRRLPPLPPTPKKKVPEVQPLPKNKSEEIVELERKLAKAKMERAAENFIGTAPQRLNDCEKAIEENRDTLIRMNENLSSLIEQFSLIKRK